MHTQYNMGHSLASVSFAPPPHAATLFVKGMERSGQVSLWIVTLRSLTLEDSRLALLLRVEKAPKSKYVCVTVYGP